MKVTTALVTAAGFGTRFLPITKTIQKEMLPILDRPVVDWVVDDLIKAGVTKIVFVISEHNRQILHFYRENKRLKKYLTDHNKDEQYQEINHLDQKAEFIFIKQDDNKHYGSATPAILAKKYLINEPAFFVVTGDDFIYLQEQQQSSSQEMLNILTSSKASGVVTCFEKPKEELSSYGVIKPRQSKHGLMLDQIIEKPKIEEAPSNLVNISKYILTPQIFDILGKQKPNAQSGELYITDTVTSLAQLHDVALYQTSGTYLDGGNPLQWLKANTLIGVHNPVWGKQYRKYLTDILNQSTK